MRKRNGAEMNISLIQRLYSQAKRALSGRRRDSAIAPIRAVSSGNVDDARSLLARGADANTVLDGRIPVLLLARSKEIVETLLDYGAKVDLPTIVGERH